MQCNYQINTLSQCVQRAERKENEDEEVSQGLDARKARGHVKNFVLHSECDRNPLEDFELIVIYC